jgi:hypothetical protein
MSFNFPLVDRICSYLSMVSIPSEIPPSRGLLRWSKDPGKPTLDRTLSHYVIHASDKED